MMSSWWDPVIDPTLAYDYRDEYGNCTYCCNDIYCALHFTDDV